MLNKGKIDPVVIPGGATGHIQAADVSWNKPIKDQLREMYDQWMDEGPHTHTKGGNMCAPPLKQIVQWMLKVWSNLDKDIIIKSFRCCASSIQDDGSEDNEIACFKLFVNKCSLVDSLNKNIQMACYIAFGGFHNDFQNNFISTPLLKAPLSN